MNSSSQSLNELIQKRNLILNSITQHNIKIDQLTKDKTEIEKKIYNTCSHSELIRENSEEKTWYKCIKCNLYKNPYMYNK